MVALLDAQAIETLFLSAITIAEIRFGIAAMPHGKAKLSSDPSVQTHATQLTTRPVRSPGRTQAPARSGGNDVQRSQAPHAGRSLRARDDGFVRRISLAIVGIVPVEPGQRSSSCSGRRYGKFGPVGMVFRTTGRERSRHSTTRSQLLALPAAPRVLTSE